MIDLAAAKPADVVSYFSELIRKNFGDKVQNASQVNAVAHGSFHVVLNIGSESYEFKFRRKSVARIAKAIRALK